MTHKIFIAVTFSAFVANAQTHRFESKSENFSANYPARWNRVGSTTLGVAEDRLDIVSFPDNQRAEGVVIKPGGAELILVRGDVPQEPWLGEKLMGQRKFVLGPASLCPTATATRVLSSIVDGQDIPSGKTIYEDVTTYACYRGHDHFSLTLRHFRGDPKHLAYEEVAKRILSSVRPSVDRETTR